MQKAGVSGSSSSKATQGRKQVVQVARQKGGEEIIECPICGSHVKAKNLVQHYDRTHKGAEVTGSAERGSTSSSEIARIATSGNVSSQRGASPDRKPKNVKSRNAGRRCVSVEATCPCCDHEVTFTRPDSTFWAQCPHCEERVWIDN